MDESGWREEALLYAFGELPAGRVPSFLLHLRECRSCQGVLEDSDFSKALADRSGLGPADFPIEKRGQFSVWGKAFPTLALAGASLGVALLVSSTFDRDRVSRFDIRVESSWEFEDRVDALEGRIRALSGEVSEELG